MARRFESGGESAEREVLVRRAAHVAIALAPLYYLLPDDLPVCGLRRWVLLIAFFAGIAAFETIRLRKGFTFMGLRPHERRHIASFVWAAAGITTVLWVFPYDIAAAALVGMAFADPLAGEMRSRGRSERSTVAASFVVYLALCSAVLVLWNDRSVALNLAIALFGAATAVSAELIKTRYVDDDFLMLVLPALVMTLLGPGYLNL